MIPRTRNPSIPGFTLLETLLVVSLFVLTIVLSAAIFANNQRSQATAESYDHLLADSRSAADYIAQAVRTATIDYPAYYDSDHNGTPEAYVPGSGPLDNPTGSLKLVDLQGVRSVITLGGGVIYQCIIDPAANDVATKCDGAAGGASWIPVTSTDTTITSLLFTIVPGSSALKRAPTSAVDCGPNATFSATLGECTCTVSTQCPTDQTCQNPSGSDQACRPNPAVDSWQPRVTLLLNGVTKKGAALHNPIETTVTSRVYLR
jgi:type II secretory pathway pseudopilin PulG